MNSMQTYMNSMQTYMNSMQTYMGSLQTYMNSLQTYMNSLQTYMNSLQTYMNSMHTYMAQYFYCFTPTSWYSKLRKPSGISFLVCSVFNWSILASAPTHLSIA